MTNIVVTERCNLRCPYCFAEDDMKSGLPDITRDEFKKIVEFITRGEDSVGIIGGEPLLHKDIDWMLAYLIDNPRVKHITLFTNGILIDEHIKLLTHPKIALLVNVNSEEDMGCKLHQRMIDNTHMMCNDYKMLYKLTFGLNMYKNKQDVSSIIDIVKEYHLDNIRFSISVPKDTKIDSKQYFQSFMTDLKKLLITMNRLGCKLSFDCNLIPICIMDSELKKLMIDSEQICDKGRRYVGTDHVSKCNPVLDIHSDGSVTRCFGLSGWERLNIKDFNTPIEIKMRFDYEIDKVAIDNARKECLSCPDHLCQKCFGGCIAFLYPFNGVIKEIQ